jgi:RimJ/RimL family protein N-acetyltransferase
VEKKYLSEKLTGERIYISKHDVSLAQTMFDYVQEDRDRLDEFLPWVEYIKSVKDEENYILSTHERWNSHTYFDYGIFLKESDTYIGNIGVHSIRWAHNCAELGYWILGKFEGHGYMSEAVKLIEKHLFEEGFHRVQIRCSDLNERSAGVPERCGYIYEGTAREDAIEKGKYRNTKTFSKLIHETDYK